MMRVVVIVMMMADCWTRCKLKIRAACPSCVGGRRQLVQVSVAATASARDTSAAAAIYEQVGIS